MTLETAVIALRDVPVGEGVGYGATWRAARPSRIAILAAGYADGVPRHLPSGAPVRVGGQGAPLAGRVSMDMIAVDVTDLPSVTVGARAELWGNGLPVDEVAARAGTIAYELLCGVAPRVPRVSR
jgi:alanine racemase